MAFTINRRLSTLVDSNGQLNTGKIPNDYIDGNHIADNTITTAMLHTSFTVSSSNLSSIDTDAVSEGSSNLYFTNARVDSHLSGGTGVTYSSGEISIGQAVATTDSPTFADLTVTGNLNITGDINSYNVTDLDVTDQTITLGAGQIEANSGGSGIIIDGASASILWDETNDEFDINKGLNVTGDLIVDTNTLKVDVTNNRVGILQASPAVSLDIGSATDALFVPKGTTAERPTGVDGYFRYNTDDAQFEGYADGAWGAIAGSGGGAAAMETDNFTGDGSTTAFTLTSSVSDEDNLLVFIEGVYQNKADYVASGTTLTFDVAPVNGRNIVAYHVRSNISGSNVILTSLAGDGSTVAFTLTAAPGNENNTQVFMDGVYQQKDSYITSGTTLTFDAAPANGATIEVISYTQTTINEPTDGSVTSAKIDSTSTGITFADLTVDTDTLVVDAANNRVGIGTTSPSELLSLSSTNPRISLNDSDSAGTASTGLIEFDATDGRSGYMGMVSGELTLFADTTSDQIIKFVNGSGEAMRIDSSGNVGIGTGTSSPLTKLHIATAGRPFTSTVDKSNGDMVGLVLTANTNQDTMNGIWFSSGSDHTGTHWSGIAGSRSDYLNTWGTHLSFFTHVDATSNITQATEKMRITSGGNVGIGTTSPSAADSADKFLAIQGSSASGINLTAGGAYGGAGMELDSGNNLKFYTGGTERMRILSSGGITFNGDTAAANALDDYEEGTWTPTYSGNSGLSSVTGITSASGTYVKVGNLVHIAANFTLNGSSSNNISPGDNIRITGQPFQSSMAWVSQPGTVYTTNAFTNLGGFNGACYRYSSYYVIQFLGQGSTSWSGDEANEVFMAQTFII